MAFSEPRMREITIRGIFLGALITVVFTASNVYLGLKVGLTVSTSIPAAVISMAILSLFSGSNILENNMVQTQASAAGTLSAVIFVLPALLMIGYWQGFPFWQTMMICGAGGFLGVIFSVPLRRTMVVNSSLPYPEGVAAAEILQVGHAQEDNKENAKEILLGCILSAFICFITSGLKVLSDAASYWFHSGKAVFQLPAGFSLALFSAGYLMGVSAGVAMLLGTILAWFGFVPFLTFQQAMPVTDIETLVGIAKGIWSSKVRFIGAGTLAIASIWTLIILFKPMLEGIALSFKALKDNDDCSIVVDRIDQDLSIKTLAFIVIGTLLVLVGTFYSFVEAAPISAVYGWGLVAFSVLITLVIGFFIASACGYMAGLVGSSNSPISGIGIIALIIVSSLLLLSVNSLLVSEQGKQFAMALAIFITSAIVAVACISNDNLQDLKTGFLVGATPKCQQIALLIGCVVGAMVIAPVLEVLYQAYGFAGAPLPREGMDASSMLSAPQATLMATITKGIFSNSLDWSMFVIGLIVGAVMIVVDALLDRRNSGFRLPALAVGLGIYLPAAINMPIAVGAILGWWIERSIKRRQLPIEETERVKQKANRKGVLIASGLIVGESLMGVLLAIVILVSLAMGFGDAPFSMEGFLSHMIGSRFAGLRDGVSVVVFVGICVIFYKRLTKV